MKLYCGKCDKEITTWFSVKPNDWGKVVIAYRCHGVNRQRKVAREWFNRAKDTGKIIKCFTTETDSGSRQKNRKPQKVEAG